MDPEWHHQIQRSDGKCILRSSRQSAGDLHRPLGQYHILCVCRGSAATAATTGDPNLRQTTSPHATSRVAPQRQQRPTAAPSPVFTLLCQRYKCLCPVRHADQVGGPRGRLPSRTLLPYAALYGLRFPLCSCIIFRLSEADLSALFSESFITAWELQDVSIPVPPAPPPGERVKSVTLVRPHSALSVC